MDSDPKSLLDEERTGEQLDPGADGTKMDEIISVGRTIVVNPGRGKRIDGTTVSFAYYNSFNYSLLPRRDDGVQLTLGITSANPGEGKSLAASNLVVSLGLGYRKKTVLVDLNFAHPTAHETFNVSEGPGLYEALESGVIHVSETKIPQLHILTAGIGPENGSSTANRKRRRTDGRVLRLDQLESFNYVINALEHEYEFVIVDMPAINGGQFPILFANRLSGMLVVVDTTRTKRSDLDKMFRQLNERQVLGFIYNKTNEDAV